jgi:hypothetical protein
MLFPAAGLKSTFNSNPLNCPSAANVLGGDGYKDFMVLLRNLVIDFKRPVTYVHGDSHVFL